MKIGLTNAALFYLFNLRTINESSTVVGDLQRYTFQTARPVCTALLPTHKSARCSYCWPPGDCKNIQRLDVYSCCFYEIWQIYVRDIGVLWKTNRRIHGASRQDSGKSTILIERLTEQGVLLLCKSRGTWPPHVLHCRPVVSVLIITFKSNRSVCRTQLLQSFSGFGSGTL
jgi:hypothetical protein